MISPGYRYLVFLAFFLYLIIVTIGYATTTNVSRAFIEFIRNACIVLEGTIIIYLLLSRMSHLFSLITTLIIFLLVILWGVELSVISGSDDIGRQNLLVNIIMAIIGLVSFSLYYNDESSVWNTAKYFSLYSIGCIILICLTGGFYFGYPPHFIFSYQTEQIQGGTVLYSQGLSKLFGMAALAAFILWYKMQNSFFSVWIVITTLFLSLSLLGGARGDSLLAIIVIVGYILFRNPWHVLGMMIASLGFLFVDLSWLNDFVIFQRFSVFSEGDLGMRDLLFLQVIELIKNEPGCLVVGCGFGYFQSYYGYPYGMYPHNIILELLVSYGLPLTLFFSFLGILGVRSFVKSQHEMKEFFLAFYIYILLVNMKSGGLFTDWFFTSASLFFISLAIKEVSKTRVL